MSRTLALIVAAFGVLAAADASAQADCYAGLRPALERAGVKDLDCEHFDREIKHLGRTAAWRGHSYDVYRMFSRDKPKGFGVPRGYTRILIFDGGGRFLGQYGGLNQPYRMKIVGSDVVLDLPPEDGNRIHLGRAKPPARVHLDGDYYDLSK